MKILKYLLYTTLFLAALMAILGFFAKKAYHIERSIEIDAPKSFVFDQVSQFKIIDKWSPWNELDPNMTKTFSATDGVVGATFNWSGNEDVGEGKQTIQAIRPDQVDMMLNISKPFKMDMPVRFVLSGDDQKTKVSWSLDPVLPFPINVWAMFTNINRAMGKDYDRGLGNLKKHCEDIIHPKYRGFEVAEQDLPLLYYIGIRAQTDTAEVHDFFATNLPKAIDALEKAGLTSTGHPTGLFWSWGGGMTDMAVTMPATETKKFTDDIESFPVGGGKALIINYFGPFSDTEEAYLAMGDYMLEKHLKNIPPVMEEHVTNPATEPDTAKWLTRIIYFVQPMVDSTEMK